MNLVTIQKTVNAWQWNGEEVGLPDGFHCCRPEVHYSADMKYVYFSYADLPSKHWISALCLTEKPGISDLSGALTATENGTPYWRETMPFAFWSIKSKATMSGDYSSKFLDLTNSTEVAAFLDYAYLEQWGGSADGVFSLPPRLEYRQVDGAYGRGYRPYYLKPGDWLVKDGDRVEVQSNEKFQEHLAVAS